MSSSDSHAVKVIRELDDSVNVVGVEAAVRIYYGTLAPFRARASRARGGVAQGVRGGGDLPRAKDETKDRARDGVRKTRKDAEESEIQRKAENIKETPGLDPPTVRLPDMLVQVVEDDVVDVALVVVGQPEERAGRDVAPEDGEALRGVAERAFLRVRTPSSSNTGSMARRPAPISASPSICAMRMHHSIPRSGFIGPPPRTYQTNSTPGMSSRSTPSTIMRGGGAGLPKVGSTFWRISGIRE